MADAAALVRAVGELVLDGDLLGSGVRDAQDGADPGLGAIPAERPKPKLPRAIAEERPAEAWVGIRPNGGTLYGSLCGKKRDLWRLLGFGLTTRS